MRTFNLLFEEKTQTTKNLIVDCGAMINIQTKIEENDNINEKDNILNTSSILKVFLRELQIESVKYEDLFHEIANNCFRKQIKMDIHFFEKPDDVLLIEILCMYFNNYEAQNLTLEFGKEEFILKANNTVIAKAFL
ncbi:hypothetical protein GINT2_000056 [Glugoides intestinalis]